jgi:hypothetical protein
MKKSILYLLVLSSFGVASCNSNKSEKNTTTTSSPSATVDEVRTINAQSDPDTLKGSLKAIAIGTVGATTVTINYYSPAVRGRVIWGGLVPFDNVWTTGAHKATNIEFDSTVKIGDTEVAPGKYGLFTIPGKDEWTIIINKNWDQHLTDEYNQKDDLVRVKVKPKTEGISQERLRYVIEAEKGNFGEIVIYWEKLEISLPIELPIIP